MSVHFGKQHEALKAPFGPANRRHRGGSRLGSGWNQAGEKTPVKHVAGKEQ